MGKGFFKSVMFKKKGFWARDWTNFRNTR